LNGTSKFVAEEDEPKLLAGNLRYYFITNKRFINEQINIIRNDLNARDFHPKDSSHKIFLNFVSSIINMFAMLSIAFTPYACKQFSQNYKSHGNIFKFYATTHADEIKAEFEQIEDKLSMQALN
jgi:hypothetical protein